MGNKTFILKKIPPGVPVPGEHIGVEDRPFDPSAAPPAGGVMLENIYSSIDPYLRGRLRHPDPKSAHGALPVGSPIPNLTVSRVLKSDAPGYAPGDLVVAYVPIAEYAVLEKDELSKIRRKIEDPGSVKDLAWFLGPLGMPSLTAYSSLHEIGKPKKGETIYINSAAGAVGQMVGQLAKREGLRVIGSVGTAEKLDFILNELGFDGGFNYKEESVENGLKRLAPEGIDIYYENVGGEQLAITLGHMRRSGRIIVCGLISEYNIEAEDRYPIKNISSVLNQQLTMRGFLVGDPDFGPKYTKEHQQNLRKWLADGSVKAKIHETVGIENAAEAFVGMLQGDNFGKAVVKIKG